MKNLAGLAPLPKFREDKSADTRCTILKRLRVHRCMVMGFTLVEMMVTIAIMSVVGSMIFFRFPLLNHSIFLQQAARSLAFTFRNAESRAVNVSQVSCGSPPCFPSSHGVFVTPATSDTMPSDGVPDNEQFILFTDRDSDGRFDPSAGCGGIADECILKYRFTNKVSITAIQSPPATPEPNGLSVLYKRPDPTVEIRNNTTLLTNIGPFIITIQQSGYSDVKTIRVWRTGQISIQ